MDNQQNPHQLLELEPIDMHGPVEVSVRVYGKTADGKVGSLTFKAETGRLPTRAQQVAMLDAFMDPEKRAHAETLKDLRPLTKPEFVEFMTLRIAGQAIPLPGNQEFVPSTCDIPHEMLVHAVMGAGCDAMFGDEHEARGIAEYLDGPNKFAWIESALEALPDDELLAIYRRITT
jgi:hypothetical protein